MKHVLIADEGCWLTRVGFDPQQESAPEFWKEVRTSEPEDYTEVTDARRIEMEEAWHEAHPEPGTGTGTIARAGASPPCG